MIQDSKILKWFKEHEHQKGWFVVLFTQPKLYLYNLLNRTFIMGFLLFVVFEILKYFHLGETQSIPSSIHSLVGIVIGLLLVFRTNTAYDRWWEARRIFSSLHATFLYFIIKSKMEYEGLQKSVKEVVIKINSDIFNFVSTDDPKESEQFKSSFLKNYEELGNLFSKFNNTAPPVYGSIERKMSEVLDQFSSLERIRNTPIPMS
ncbi:MAG TPA: bestrophin family ion channel, partial [Allocoleopsis sp.]